MNFLSLFAGIGGFDLGLERAGMKCVGQVEWDPYCQAVLAHHWPEVPRVSNIKEVKGDSFKEKVNLICGGFPCQPFSVAGKQRGDGDDRYLWPEMFRVIRAYRPTWVLGENVPGIVKMALDTVLADLEGEGYACQTFLVPACGVDAPHRRERVWIVARRRAANVDDAESGGRRFSLSTHVGAVERDVHASADTGSNVAHAAQRQDVRRERGSMEETESGGGCINTPLVAGGEDVPHPPGDRRLPRRPESILPREAGRIAGGGGEDVADAELGGLERSESPQFGEGETCGRRRLTLQGGEDVPDSDRPGWTQRRLPLTIHPEHPVPEHGCSWLDEAAWFAKSGMGRLAHGVPGRVAQIRALGNAIVPKIAEEFGRMILTAEEA